MLVKFIIKIFLINWSHTHNVYAIEHIITMVLVINYDYYFIYLMIIINSMRDYYKCYNYTIQLTIITD